MKKINLTKKKIIIYAIIIAIYNALMCILPITSNTSFRDITVSFEVWILLGIIIIMNSKSPKDSSINCFIFFLVSMPLIYLFQIPFNSLGFGIFKYYTYWFKWTLLTIPMGYIGYYIKNQKWYSYIILLPMILLLYVHFYTYLTYLTFYFPYHLLTVLYILITTILLPIILFNNKIIKYIYTILSIIVFTILIIYNYKNPYIYNTTLIYDNTTYFDNKYTVKLEDSYYGKVYIEYDNNLECYIINSNLYHGGTTKLILSKDNNVINTYKLDIKLDTFNLTKE